MDSEALVKNKSSGNIGSAILAWRQKHSMSTRQLSKIIGVSHATLSRIENHNSMDQRTMILVMMWLFGGKKSKSIDVSQSTSLDDIIS